MAFLRRATRQAMMGASRKAPTAVEKYVRSVLEQERTFDAQTRELFWMYHVDKLPMVVSAFWEAMRGQEFEENMQLLEEFKKGDGEKERVALTWFLGECQAVIDELADLPKENRGRDNEGCIRALVLSSIKTYAAEFSGVSFESECVAYRHVLRGQKLQPLT